MEDINTSEFVRGVLPAVFYNFLEYITLRFLVTFPRIHIEVKAR